MNFLSTGRIWVHGIGGGLKKWYRMVDNKRIGPKEGEPLVERVQKIRKDDCRSGFIAAVASGDHARYILAPHNVKEGDLIKTSSTLTRMAGTLHSIL